MELSEIDLNLLLLFQRLMQERRVSSVAEQMNMSQPGVSKWVQVPEDRMHATASFLGVEPRELRPDLFPPWAGH